MSDFDEKANSMLIEIPWDNDGDECGVLCLSQPVEDCNTLTGSDLTRLGNLATFGSSFASEEMEGIRKNWFECKEKLNDSKVESKVERGTKIMLLNVFEDACAKNSNMMSNNVQVFLTFSLQRT